MKEPNCCRPGCKNLAKAVGLVVPVRGDAAELALCQDHIGDLGVDYVLPDPTHVRVDPSAASYEECRLHKVVFFYEREEYFIVLRGGSSRSVFLVQTGYVEACSVYGAVKASSHPTPFTYQFIVNLLHGLDASVEEAVFDGYDKDLRVYESHLVIRKPNGKVVVRCRGSDAVGISFVAKTPIRVNTAFLGREASP
jgi:bifunctional DNase/RNase